MASKIVMSEEKNVMIKELRTTPVSRGPPGPGFHVTSDRQAAAVASYLSPLSKTSVAVAQSKVSLGGPSANLIMFAGKPQ
eukprot:CAMPEP_0197877074 /NCGR_PEP_ID=MMETSP1439-20131203/5896_1 /TAXON_ID=66791 /ORGANISM="Gonyaulax spinifera, Strain CCMP409" /LENGTH=79 /DNA_ID=CAMNT_0043496403 /DNA_START=79 /DNA_END=318 /DNA_ORIENTATION=+